jgi:predicted site-specific integrase-resolvase
MAFNINGVVYYAANDVAGDVGVSRQTLWRWRKGGKIPTGHRLRDGQLLFTAAEVEAVRAYAQSIEPAIVGRWTTRAGS